MKEKLFVTLKTGEIVDTKELADYYENKQDVLDKIFKWKFYLDYDFINFFTKNYETGEKIIVSYDEILEEFTPEFRYDNLTMGYYVNEKAVENLLKNHTKEELLKIDNYDELGLVEAVRNDEYIIENNHIIALEEID